MSKYDYGMMKLKLEWNETADASDDLNYDDDYIMTSLLIVVVCVDVGQDKDHCCNISIRLCSNHHVPLPAAVHYPPAVAFMDT